MPACDAEGPADRHEVVGQAGHGDRRAVDARRVEPVAAGSVEGGLRRVRAVDLRTVHRRAGEATAPLVDEDHVVVGQQRQLGGQPPVPVGHRPAAGTAVQVQDGRAGRILGVEDGHGERSAFHLDPVAGHVQIRGYGRFGTGDHGWHHPLSGIPSRGTGRRAAGEGDG